MTLVKRNWPRMTKFLGVSDHITQGQGTDRIK